MTAARKAFVIGHPIAHSRSPMIHNHWLADMKITGSYQALDIEPDKLKAFLSSLGPDQEFIGGNITIPHKQAAFFCCDQTSSEAAQLKAVNTVWFEAGKLHGDNTDGYGFIANLDQQAGGWDQPDRIAVILGAGGAARAILLALERRGIKRIFIVNRTPARARQMVQELGINAEVFASDEQQPALQGAGLLINATSLGMSGQPPLELDLSVLAPTAIVADIVYSPLETALLAAARRLGFVAVDGLGMLLHQAAPGFARWFGQTPIVGPALRQKLVADLEAKQC